jgi:hypothetical protein
MARGPSTFRPGDVKRAIKAVRDAGLEVQRVEFDQNGRPVIVTGKPEAQDENTGGKEWDRL